MSKKIASLVLFAVAAYGQQVDFGSQGYNVTTFSGPSGSQTNPGSISDAGVVAGTYTPAGQTSVQSYLRSPDGTFTTISPPGATGSVYAYSITSGGEVYGYYNLTATTYQGFVYAKGEYRLISIQGKSSQIFAGNDNGAFLGLFADAAGSFVYRPGQSFVNLHYPGQQGTYGSAINDHGVIVGFYTDDCCEGSTNYGFELAGNSYTLIDIPPGGRNTTPAWINNKGVIVGSYLATNGRYRGFVYANGNFRDFGVTGAAHTFVSGCNDEGVLSGTYQDASGNQIGFIATPMT